MVHNPITYLEIDAWARQMQKRPEPWEIDALKQLDARFMAAQAKANADQQKKKA